MCRVLRVAGVWMAVWLAGCAGTDASPEARGSPAGGVSPPTAFEAQAVPSLGPSVMPGAAVMEWLAVSRWASGLGVEYTGLEIAHPRPERAQVRLTGLRDDAVGAYEYRLELDEVAAGWVVRRAERRAICRRGLGATGLCL